MNDLSKRNCTLITNLLLNITDLVLVGLSIMTLMSKKNLEKTSRTHIVWMFDISKQIIGEALIASINLGISFLIFKDRDNNRRHVWNFLNFFIENTLGVIIVSGVHYMLCRLCTLYFGKNSSYSKIGYYGYPPKYRVWMIQLIPYLFSLIINKVITLRVLFRSYSFLFKIGEQIFFLLNPYPTFDLIIIFILCPRVLKIFRFWIFDFILREQVTENGIIKEVQPIFKNTEESYISDINNSHVKLSTKEDNSDSETQITI